MRKTLVAVFVVLLSPAVYAAKPMTGVPLPPADDYTVVAGKVMIGTIDAHTIGVVVNEGETRRHLFRLWTGATVKPFRATSQSASVEFRGDELVVMASDHEWFYSLVTATGDLRVVRSPAGFSATRFVGYGLNHEIRSLMAQHSSRLNVVALDDCEDFGSCFFYPDYDLGGGGASCDSGGIGSSSCATSNSSGACTVSCNPGWYACCTAATFQSGANCRCKQ